MKDMNETKKTQNQSCKSSKAQNNAQKKATGEQTPSPAVPNRAFTEMSNCKKTKGSK